MLFHLLKKSKSFLWTIAKNHCLLAIKEDLFSVAKGKDYGIQQIYA